MNLITPSLLNAWNYYFDAPEDYDESSKQSFLDALNKIKYPQTDVQLEGVKFEEHVRCIREFTDEDERYRSAVLEAREVVKNGVWGMSCSKQITIDGNEYLLYGRPDVVRGPTCFDIKWTGTYSYGKYINNTQHPLYMYCLDALWDFQYVVYDGLRIHVETYQRGDCQDIIATVSDFISWLKWNNLYETYQEKWRARE